MAQVLNLDATISMKNLLTQYQANAFNGAMPVSNFNNLMQFTFRLREEEVKHLINAFDPTGRGEIRMAEILEELKELVTNHTQRFEISDIVTSIGKSPVGGASAEAMILSQYSQDLEEIYRAVIARGFINTAALF